MAGTEQAKIRSMIEPAPAVGVACLLFRQGKLLLGRRPKPPQQNSWQCPGGFLHFNETPQQAGERILRQRLGLELTLENCGFYTNNLFTFESQHTLSLYLSADCQQQNITHPDWQWFDIKQLPQPLFLPLEILLNQHHDEIHRLIRKA